MPSQWTKLKKYDLNEKRGVPDSAGTSFVEDLAQVLSGVSTYRVNKGLKTNTNQIFCLFQQMIKEFLAQ